MSSSGGYKRVAFRKKRYVKKGFKTRIPRPFRKARAPVRPGLELKAVDVVQTGETLTFDTGQVHLLNGCAQGVEVNQHVGRKTSGKSVQIIGKINTNGASASSESGTVRFAIVWDREPNTTAGVPITPIWTDVFLPVVAVAAGYNYNNPVNLSNRNRFKVLYDKNWVINLNYAQDASSTININIKPVKIFLKLPKGCDTIFRQTDATVASIQTGACWLFMLASPGSGHEFGAAFTSRYRYYDG